MKKIYISLIVLIPAIAILFAFTNGPDAGYTGSPIDGKDCTDCHPPGPATTVNGWIIINAGANGYTPGETYTVTVFCQDISADKLGFQITSETASAKAGTWVITNSTRTQLKGGTAVTHTSAGTVAVSTPNTWTMDWTAPEEGTGEVSFYLAVNKTDDDGTNQDDQIYVCSHTIQESNVGIAEHFESLVGDVYPNPATDRIHLNAPAMSEITVFDNSGREVISIHNEQATHEMDVSNLQQGLYFVRIGLDGQFVSRTFIKR